MMNITEFRKFLSEGNELSSALLEGLDNMIPGYDIVYRGQGDEFKDDYARPFTWVSHDYEHASEYVGEDGEVKSFKLPHSMDIISVIGEDWDDLVFEYDELGYEIDDEDMMFNPTAHFVDFLKKKGHDGFMHDENILIADMTKLIPINE